MNIDWFVIVNPVSGNGNFKKRWNTIQQELTKKNITYKAVKTTHSKHEIELVHTAITDGFTNIISIGGDGTLHHIINGIMTQKIVETSKITVAVIPLGTGNDWIKTYKIPTKISNAVQIIKQHKKVYQDIGFLELKNTSSYFNNVAGIGYDGYVVNKLNTLKKFGAIAYLLSGIAGLLLYKKTTFTIQIDDTTITAKSLMTLFGICKFSGGGMQLTKYKSSVSGLLDITVVKNFSFIELIAHIKQLYSGKILNHKKVSTFEGKKIIITPEKTSELIYIQADGELIGTGAVKVSILPRAIQIVTP